SIDEQMALVLISTRITQLVNELGIKDKPLFFTTSQGVDNKTGLRSNKFKTLITRFDAGLVVIDNRQDVLGGKDENDTAQAVNPMMVQKSISRDLETAIIGNQHLNKRCLFRGLRALKGAVDTLISLRRDGPLFRFENEKSRVGTCVEVKPSIY
ncbi:MAG: hypothetical protein WBE28_10330, partial [bacterium]